MIKTEIIQLADYQELASFLAFHWDREPEFWLERFQFLWDKNPAFSQDPIRGLLVKKNNAIKGFIGKFPVRIQLDGKEVISSNAIGLVIDQDLRGGGVGRQLKNRHTELSQGKFIFATSGNKISVKINTVLGFKPLPRGIGAFNLYSLLPIRLYESLKLYFYLLASSRSMLSLKSIWSVFHLKRKRLKKFKPLRVEKINHADEAFDRLWTRTKTIYKNTHVRSADVINWYLLPTQYADREVYAAYDGNNVVGYIVVRLSIIKKIRFMLCLDLWVRPENADTAIKSLLIFAKKQATGKNCSALLVPHFSKDMSNRLIRMRLPQAIGKKRNDLFLMPQDFAGNITVENSYFTYMSGDKFLEKTVI